MHFLMQMDSDLPTADGRGWLWAVAAWGMCFGATDVRLVACFGSVRKG